MREPLAVYVVKRAGWKKGLAALTYLTAWGLASDELGHGATVQEYAEFWHQSLSKSYAEREMFVLCWPTEKSPERLWALVRKSVSGVGERDVAMARASAVVGDWSPT